MYYDIEDIFYNRYIYSAYHFHTDFILININYVKP